MSLSFVSSTRFRRMFHLLAAVVGTVGMVGCDLTGMNGGPAVFPDVSVTGVGQYALAATSFQLLRGTYQGCTGQSSGAAWTAAINGTVIPAGENALKVAQNDANCRLRISSFQVGGNTYSAGASAFTLDVNYQAQGIAFVGPSGSKPFYANAKISDLTFAADFAITAMYSDDPAAVMGTVTPTYKQVNGSVNTTTVAAPNYTFNGSGITLEVDAQQKVDTVSGTVSIVAGTQAGQNYFITRQVNEVLDAVTLQTAYASRAQAGTLTTISGTGNFTIAATSLITTADNLTNGQTVYIVIINTDNTSKISAFEVISVMFRKAP